MSESIGRGTKLKALAIIVVGVVALLVLGTGLLVLLAFGVGKLLSFLLPLTTFEASLLSMLGMLGLLAAGWRLVESFVRVGPPVEWYQDQEDDTEEEEEEDEEDFEPVIDHEVIEAVVEMVARNARCPCGSRRKFKNCCGRRTAVARA